MSQKTAFVDIGDDSASPSKSLVETLMLPKKLKRQIKRGYVRLVGSKESVYSTSMGVAIGFFWSVAIPLFQVFLAFAMAFVMKASKSVAVLFTFFSNPYTTPFLYTGACLLGAKILGLELTAEEIKTSFKEVYSSFSFDAIGRIGWKLLISYLIGGPIIGLILAVPSYFISANIIKSYQKRRAKKRVARIAMHHE